MIQEEIPAPPPSDSPLRTLAGRNIIGWLVLALFFALFGAQALTNSTSETSAKNLALHDTQQELLQRAMRHKWFQLNTARKPVEPWNEQTDRYFRDLDPAIGQMKKDAEEAGGKDLMARKLYAAMSFERERTIDPAVIAPLKAGPRQVDRDFWAIYGSSSLSPTLARNLANQLPNYPPVYKVAKVHAFEKAGLTGGLDTYFKVDTRATGVLSAIEGGITIASIMVWAALFAMWKAGTFAPLGIPMDGLSPRGADRLAIHAAVLLTSFIGVGVGVSYMHIPGTWGQLVAGVSLLALVLIYQRVKFDGVAVSLAELGVSTQNLAANIRLGVLGFCAEFPVALILAGIGAWVFRFLPAPTHPVSQALEANHKFSVVFPLIAFGSIITPIWEELAFRGLLFPALKRYVGLVPSIVVSSLLFGLIHPQGPALVVSLAAVGAASCVLSYKSKSLVPSMVMHCLHNSLAFATTLLLT